MLHTTTRALADTILMSRGLVTDGRLPAVAETGAFVCRRIKGMPVFLRVPMIVLTMIFVYDAILVGFKPFPYLNLKLRSYQFRRWQNSWLGVAREWAAFYEKMTLFAFYSLTESAGPRERHDQS